MKRIEFLYLSQEDVIDVGLTMKEVIPVIEDVLRQHALGKVENPPKPGVHPLRNAFIHAMPGYLSGKGVVGMKWVSSFPGNRGEGLPAVMGLVVLNDVHTGRPLAVMDCRWITAMRTGAASAVAAKYLARPETETIGIVGAGIQGRYNLLALSQVLPEIRLVRVFDVRRESMETYIASMSETLSLRIEAGKSLRDVIEGADVVVTATGRLDRPIFKEEWINPGALVLPVHHRGWENRALHGADKFVTDDWTQLQQAHRETGGFYGPLPRLYAELGEIVTGRKAGREDDRERIIDFNYGLAVEDVALAQEVFTGAKNRGLGTVLSLMEGDLPLC
ncbi:MAG: ornithine cyclodeaminase family protein [Deltaproteobacteria bacterium]|nr:ornithine cyclodeaminase family protein [Deltaproteobacteria bacterium]